jgi:signal-transduction protein with cAMP-binding, CBS, and nucleotidyltransferase domain
MGCGSSAPANVTNEPEIQELGQLQEYLARVPMFKPIPQMDRLALAKSFEKRRYKADEDVCVQGSNGTEFYIVGKGELVVTVNDTAVATLAAGDYFGETGLTSGQARNATITAEEPAMCFVLTRAKFEKLGMKIKGDTLKAKGRKTVNAAPKKSQVPKEGPRVTQKKSEDY